VEDRGFSLAVLTWNLLLGFGVVLVHFNTALFIFDTSASFRIRHRNFKRIPPIVSGPKITILIPACNEHNELLLATLYGATHQKYRNTQVLLIENSSDDQLKSKALKVAEDLGVYSLDIPCAGSKAAALNRALKEVNTPYIAVLDADQIPKPDFVGTCLAHFEEKPDLAFVQCPQVYRNVSESIIALAADAQQFPFYSYLLPGRSRRSGVYCVGTNVIFRLEHLRQVGGFDESSITEDIATSFRLHAKGYASIYVEKSLVEGVGPTSFSAYLTQQHRWACGTIQMLHRLLRSGRTCGGRLSLYQWVRYLAGALYYLNGTAHLVFLAAPLVACAGILASSCNIVFHDPFALTLPLRLLFYGSVVTLTIGWSSPDVIF